MADFLVIEYERCLDLLKYYDERQHSLLRFATGVSSAVLSVIVAVMNHTTAPALVSWELISLLSLITALGLAALFSAMVQTRLYFVFPARQVNALRKHMLALPTNSFKDNQMYLDTTFPAFKFRSTQTTTMFLVGLQAGAMFSFGLGALLHDQLPPPVLIIGGALLSVLVAVALICVARLYMLTRGALAADHGIHGHRS